jgi:hypothetical protein
MKTSLQGWHTWFYCENHEPNLPPFVGWLPKFQGTWSEEPTPLELPQVDALTNKINTLKEWPDRSVRGCPLAGPSSHPSEETSSIGWEYSGVQDLTRETNDNITSEHLVKLSEEMFQDTTSYPTDG